MTQNNEQGKAGRPRKYYEVGELKRLTELKRAEIVRVMEAEGRLNVALDTFAIDVLSALLAKIELADKWLQEHDLFTDEYEGTMQPILKHYTRWLNTAGRYLNDLGLTPAARARQKAKLGATADLASQIQREKTK